MTKRTTTEAELREWIAQGKTKREIAEILGTHPVRVSAACGVLGLNAKSRKKGERAPVEEYVAGLRRGMTLAEVAREHGRSHSAVYVALIRAGLPTCTRKAVAADVSKAA